MQSVLENSKDFKRLRNLILFLASQKGEEDWYEFKTNYADPDGIGEYVSSLSNSALLCGHGHGYLVWGIDDKTHELLGTTFNPVEAKKGNEELENYLSHMTNPSLATVFYRLYIDGKPFVVLQIPSAKRQPTAFAGKAYIRIGSNSRPLSKHPEKELKLWTALAASAFETEVCLEELSEAEALSLLDYEAYFRRRKIPVPKREGEIISALLKDRLLAPCDSGKTAITNLGGLLLAKDFTDFPTLISKSVRVIRYEGKSRTKALSDVAFQKGYAVCFDEIVSYLGAFQSQKEEIGIYRETKGAFPSVVLREVLANVMVHQDLLDSGSSPTIELFTDGITATNPGKLLVDASRVIDTTPVCRNEILARQMRLLGIIEERGSGFDRIEEYLAELKAPSSEVSSDDFSTKIRLSSKFEFSKYSEKEAMNTIYTYCCFSYINRDEKMNNEYFRVRFGLREKDAPVVSRLLSKAVDMGLLKLSPSSTGMRNRTYLPYWA